MKKISMMKAMHVHVAAAMLLPLCAVQGSAQQMAQARLLQTAGDSALNIAPAPDSGAQVRDELLEGLDRLGANAKEKNEVNLDKNMLAMAGSGKSGRYADLAQKMDFITVRNYEFANKGQYQMSDLDVLRHRLEGDGWSHVVRNESNGETNDIVVKADREGLINDMVILNAEPKELNIVHLRGHFRMQDVQSAMGSAMGVMGSAMGSLGGAMGRVGAVTGHPAPPSPPVPPPAASDQSLKKR